MQAFSMLVRELGSALAWRFWFDMNPSARHNVSIFKRFGTIADRADGSYA
jgi:hypothetical protein